jgi:hypothetical protein
VSARFQVDLLRPGRVAFTWKDWFLGPEGPRRLVMAVIASSIVLSVILALGLLPSYWRLSGDLGVLPRLRREVSTSQNDLNVLRANLQSLAVEARRHLRWGDLLTTFSNQTPPTLRLQRVETVPGPGPGAGGAGASPPGSPAASPPADLRIEAIMPLRPGSAPLVDAAQFMAGLMRDPILGGRYELKSWEIRPVGGGAGTPDGAQFLLISVMLSDRAS